MFDCGMVLVFFLLFRAIYSNFSHVLALSRYGTTHISQTYGSFARFLRAGLRTV